MTFDKILLTGSLVLMALVVFFTGYANAQATDETPSMVLVSGTYTVRAQMGPDADTAQFCAVRVDLPDIIELGCIPAGADEIVSMQITVDSTPDDDAEIRGYAVDESGLVSVYSGNFRWIDFTAPQAPTILQ